MAGGDAAHNVRAAPQVHPAQLPPPPTRSGGLVHARALQLGGHPSRVHPALPAPPPPLRQRRPRRLGVEHPEHRHGSRAVTLDTGLHDAEVDAPSLLDKTIF